MHRNRWDYATSSQKQYTVQCEPLPLGEIDYPEWYEYDLGELYPVGTQLVLKPVLKWQELGFGITMESQLKEVYNRGGRLLCVDGCLCAVF